MATPAEISCATVDSKPTRQLLDLHVDILLKILRDFIPVKDKLHTLFKMKEFRHLVKYRGSYLSSPAPFSLEYLRFLRHIRTGWYVNRDDWSHRFCLEIEESTLHLTMRHFKVAGYRKYFKANAHYIKFSETLDYVHTKLNDYLVNYHSMDSMNLLTYYLRGYGFIMIDHSFLHGLQKMRFYNGSTCMIEVGKKMTMDYHRRLPHFTVLLTPEKKLVVECQYPFNVCPCEARTQVLSPFTFQVAKKSTILTWDEGKKQIPVISQQQFQLMEDGKHVTAVTNNHMNCHFPQITSLQINYEEAEKRHIKRRRTK